MRCSAIAERAAALLVLAAACHSQPRPSERLNFVLPLVPPLPARGNVYARKLWPLSVLPVFHPRVTVTADGKRAVAAYPLDACRAPLDAAEEAYRKRDCATAAAKYREALAASPACYPANIGLGDCAFLAKNGREAIEQYRIAEELNPDDYQPWLFEADALMRVGNRGEARDRFVRALTLFPRQPSALKMLAKAAPLFMADLRADDLEPAAVMRVRDGKPELDVAESRKSALHWQAYATCKARGPGPQSEPPAQGVSPSKRPWRLDEERACVEQLANAYRSGRAAEPPVAAEPALDRLVAAQDAGMTGAFVLYEIASRLDPQITLKVSPESQRQVRSYVERFVLPDRSQ